MWRLAGVCQASGWSQSWMLSANVRSDAYRSHRLTPTVAPSRTARTCPKSPDMATSGASESVMWPTPAGPSPHSGPRSAIVPGVCPSAPIAPRRARPHSARRPRRNGLKLSPRTRRSRPQPTADDITPAARIPTPATHQPRIPIARRRGDCDTEQTGYHHITTIDSADRCRGLL